MLCIKQWRRSRVVQGTVLARKATIVYITISASWTMFAKAAMDYLQRRAVDDLDRIEFMRAWNVGEQDSRTQDALNQFSSIVLIIETTRIEWNSSKAVTLLPLSRRFRSRKSSDDRDKVFSFLGLVNQRAAWPVSINYDSSMEQVYGDAVVNIIRETKSLAVLGGTLHEPGSSGPTFRLPTWGN